MGKGDKNMQLALCVSTAVICRGLYCERGGGSKVSLFISLHKSPSLLKNRC